MRKVGVWIILLSLSVLTLQSCAQSKEASEVSKAEKKEQEARKMAKQRKNILQQLRDTTFVLEALRLTDRYGNSVNVSDNTNFIAAQGAGFTLQYAFQGGGLGRNGLGGLTIDGRITDYEILNADEKDKALRVNFSVQSPGVGFANVSMSVFGNSRADATISGAFGSRIRMYGYFSSLQDSDVFKGTPVF